MIGDTIYRTRQTSNSMAWARQHVYDAPHGTVFLADTFLRAHGRQGRTWSLYPGQLMVTLLLKPQRLSSSLLFSLGMAVTLGILDPLRVYGVKVKWPNDFVLTEKKLGGMIMEVIWEDQPAVIIGFALNINTVFLPNDLLFNTAISLAMVTHKTYDCLELQSQLFQSLNDWYTRWERAQYETIFTMWKQAQSLTGKFITTHQRDGSIVCGRLIAYCPDGSVILRCTEGEKIIPHYAVDLIRVEY